MNEWTDKYNPFNSMKALVHADKFEAILNGKPKPPIVVNFDLTNLCNYNCSFCMFGGRKRADPSGETYRFDNSFLPRRYALKLPKIWKEWGVKAVCLAGGGEPTLHPDCKEFIKETNRQGLDLGFVTNGYLVNNEDWWDVVSDNTKFVGFSIDAGTPEVYAKVKGVNPSQFQKTINNLEQICRRGKTQVGYKFLLDKHNQNDIYQAAKIAHMIGVNHFQFRPAIDDYKYSKQEIKNIWGQISQAQRDFEDENFKVFGVSHKFNQDLTKKHKFDNCRANLLTTTWCADGNVYMCTDTRGCEWSKLVEHYPSPQKVIDYWGSPDHLEKVKKINHRKNCDRCTLTAYNEMFNQVFIKDKMDRNLI